MYRQTAGYVVSLCLLLLPALSGPLIVPDRAYGDTIESQTVARTLLKAAGAMRALAVDGGFAGIHRLSTGRRYGEATYDPLSKTEIMIQPPGTPAVGACFLRAYRITGAPWYGEAALEAGQALAWTQSKHGGWDRTADIGDKEETPATHATLDDNTSQAATRFLIELQQALPRPWQTEAIGKALHFLLASQFANGAWPQDWPARGDYRDYYTFNDGAINRAIQVMLLAYDTYGNVRYLQAARAGLSFVLSAQLPEPNPGWAQQYDHSLHPAAARPFEPAALSSTATRRNIRTLLNAYVRFGTVQYETALLSAANWLKRRRIGRNLWARFYDFEDVKPLYADPKGRTYVSINALPSQIRSRYRWQGNFGIPGTLKDVDRLVRLGRPALQDAAAADAAKRSKRLFRRARRRLPDLIRNLNAEGYWLRGAKVHSADFTANCHLLLDYLARKPV